MQIEIKEDSVVVTATKFNEAMELLDYAKSCNKLADEIAWQEKASLSFINEPKTVLVNGIAFTPQTTKKPRNTWKGKHKKPCLMCDKEFKNVGVHMSKAHFKKLDEEHDFDC